MAKGKLTEKRRADVASEMRDLGYRCDVRLVQRVYDWHRTHPLPDNAALASNILDALERKGVDTTPTK